MPGWTFTFFLGADLGRILTLHMRGGATAGMAGSQIWFHFWGVVFHEKAFSTRE